MKERRARYHRLSSILQFSHSQRGICPPPMNAPDKAFSHDARITAAADRLEPKVVAWRRDFHENPELGNREVRTAKVVADHLRSLGFDEVVEKVAHTGVVGTLKGRKPGPVVALRADMDSRP